MEMSLDENSNNADRQEQLTATYREYLDIPLTAGNVREEGV